MHLPDTVGQPVLQGGYPIAWEEDEARAMPRATAKRTSFLINGLLSAGSSYYRGACMGEQRAARTPGEGKAATPAFLLRSTH
jgi:hypothetical protein